MKMAVHVAESIPVAVRLLRRHITSPPGRSFRLYKLFLSEAESTGRSNFRPPNTIHAKSVDLGIPPSQGMISMDDRVNYLIGRWYSTPAERETERTRENWWKFETVYQLYPRSFQDSNGDGIGDLQGVIQRLDYLKEIGIGIVWLCPIYTSPMKDLGYDITDFCGVDKTFGTMKDFEELVREMHARDIRLVMDFVPNHTSAQHPWFQKSRRREMPFKNYYVWHPGHPHKKAKNKNGEEIPAPPNNWVSVFNGPMWEWDEERKEYYLHQFMVDQPDLDFRNPDVRIRINQTMRFWFDKGCDGLRIDALKHVFESDNNNFIDNDEPVDPYKPTDNPTHSDFYRHTQTQNQNEAYAMLAEWYEFYDTYARAHNREHLLLIPECVENNLGIVMRYYMDNNKRCSDFPFNFLLMGLRNPVRGIDIAHAVDAWMWNMPKGCWANWVLSTHDQPRVATRVDSDRIDLLNALVLLLPGTPTTYYGEELGMANNMDITIDQVQDKMSINEYNKPLWRKFCRDFCRTPMQWSAEKNAGFTDGTPWLPVDKSYEHLNVEAQRADPHSHLNFYKALQKLRREPTFAGNPYLRLLLINEHVFSFERSAPGLPTYLIVIDCRSATQWQRERSEKEKMKQREEADEVLLQSTGTEEQKRKRAFQRQNTREFSTQTDEADEVGLLQTDLQSLFGFPRAEIVLKSKSPVQQYAPKVGTVVALWDIYTFPSQVIVLRCQTEEEVRQADEERAKAAAEKSKTATERSVENESDKGDIGAVTEKHDKEESKPQ